MDHPLILYLHGFRSSPQSVKARAFGEFLTARGAADAFVCPALSPVPDAAIAQAEAILAVHPGRRVALVGSSLGGFYATVLAERHGLPAALVNPAVPRDLDFDLLLGRHANLYTGEEFEFTAEHAAQIGRLDPPSLHPDRYWLLLEAGDEVLDPGAALRRYAGARVSLEPDGDHSFTRFASYLPELAAWAGL